MNNELGKIIGNRINTLLAEQNKKQKDLAAYLGVQDNTISYFASGRRLPNTGQIIKIAEFFKTSCDYLLGQTNAKTSDREQRFVCEYTGLNDVTVVKLHRNIGKTINHCNQTIDYLLSDRAEYVFISFSDELRNYREAVTQYNAFMDELNTMDVGHFQNTYNDMVDSVALSEYRLQNTAQRLMEIFGDPKKSLSQDEIDFTKRLIGFMMKESDDQKE